MRHLPQHGAERRPAAPFEGAPLSFIPLRQRDAQVPADMAILGQTRSYSTYESSTEARGRSRGQERRNPPEEQHHQGLGPVKEELQGPESARQTLHLLAKDFTRHGFMPIPSQSLLQGAVPSSRGSDGPGGGLTRPRNRCEAPQQAPRLAAPPGAH